MLRPKIGLDWDDVTAPFNEVAVAMANEKYGFEPPLVLSDITSWENTGRAGVIKEFYRSEELYRRQKVAENDKRAIRKLMEIADVYFITAVYPEFMGVRAKQILEAFPDFPPENIIMGNAKFLVHFDIILDDAIHNVLDTPAAYPVMMRRPWNRKMTGLLSVNSLPEFVSLVKQILRATKTKLTMITEPSVIALVGPSGAGKTEIAEKLCEDSRFTCPKTYCTKQSSKHIYLSEEEFEKENFFEKTIYAGVQYGNKKEEIQEVLDGGRCAVMPLDMCGAVAMKRHFPTAIIFVDRDKEFLIRNVVEDIFPAEEKTLRILSIDAEKQNRAICDCVIDNRDEQGAERIRNLVHFWI